MQRQYRALISIPISADDDNAALDAAAKASMDNDGHVELVGETAENSLRIVRVVHAESLLMKQLPLDWTP
jgi:hypothetical protein